jgi:hypothetical protein
MKYIKQYRTFVGVVLISLLAGCLGDADLLGKNDDELVLGSLNRRSMNPTICWVYNSAKVTMHTAADFWTETTRIEGILKQWENASGLKFNWTSASGTAHHDCGTTGNEDIRALLYDSNVLQGDAIPDLPGQTCTKTERVDYNGSDGGVSTIGTPVTGDLGSFPDEAPYYAGCKYNARVGYGAKQNQYLHEFGHTLGFAHEHERFDNDNALCPWNGTLRNPDNPYLTYYDVNSVMHYNWGGKAGDPWEHCPAPGNWGDTGLSAGDILGIEMVYPASYTTKVYTYGVTLFREDQRIPAIFDWINRGASIKFLTNPTLRLKRASDGAIIYNEAAYRVNWGPQSAQKYIIEGSIESAFSELFSSTTNIEVLTPSNHTALIMSVIMSFIRS